MSKRPIRDYSLPRHYTPLGHLGGRYEIYRFSVLYKLSYIKKIVQRMHVLDIATIAYTWIEKQIEHYKNTRYFAFKKMAYQAECSFKYKNKKGEEQSYTVKTVFMATIDMVLDEIFSLLTDVAYKFEASDITVIEEINIVFNVIIR